MASKGTVTTRPIQLDFVLVNGEFEVHRHNCRDAARAVKNRSTDYDEVAVIDLDPTDTPTTIIAWLWDDQIRESNGLPEDVTQEQVDDGTWVPDAKWLADNMFTAHFNPCIKSWVTTKEQTCSGSGEAWQAAEGTAPNNVECPGCGATAEQFLGSGEIEKLPRKRSGKWAPRVPEHAIEVETVKSDEEILNPTKASKAKGTASASGKAEAKRVLATLVARSIAQMLDGLADENSEDSKAILAQFTKDECAVMAATWIHHIPADRTRWVGFGLPRPDRSDWREADPTDTPTAPDPDADPEGE